MAFGRRKKEQRRNVNPNRVRSSPHSKELLRLARELEGAGFTPDEALTASGELVRHGMATYLRRLIMPWQIRSFGYYDLVGEIKFAAQFYARALANVELFAAEKDENGKLRPTKNTEVIDAFERIKDPGGGGRSGLQASYGRLMFLVGEALLFCSVNSNTRLEQWEMLSTDELRLLDGNYTRFMAPVLPATLFKPAPDDDFVPVGMTRKADGSLTGSYDQTAVAYRLWQRHPRFSALPDCTMQGVLDIVEELVLLTQVVRARARSRLAGSGILFLDDRISTRPDEPTPDEDPLEDPFIADLTEAAMSPIVDEGTASAVVPMIARVKVPDGMALRDLVYHLQIVDPTQLYPETGLRMECIRRLAIALDMPPEALLGLETLNHWNAWLVDETTWKGHIQPIVRQLVEDLTSAYLQPYLRQQNVDGWDNFFVGYDATNVINRPDRTKDALQLHGVGALGDDALLEVFGFDTSVKPTEEELARIVGMAIRDSSLAWDGIPSVRAGGIEAQPGEIITPQGEQGSPETTTEPGAGDETKGPPPDEGPPEDRELVGSTYAAVMRASQLAGAAQLSLLRARESAGNRLLTLLRRDAETKKLVDGCPTGQIASKLGRARVRELIGGAKEADLISGARELTLDGLRVFGVTDSAVADTIAETIQKHAARTLYEERPGPLPPEFVAYVQGLLSGDGRNGDSGKGRK
jgi:hypothetical protein